MTAMIASWWGRWIEFASRERFLLGASLFRIGAGLTLLYQLLINYHQRAYLYGPDGVWPYSLFLQQLAELRSFSLYAVSTSPLWFEIVFHLTLLVLALWVAGWHTRLMTLLTFVLMWSLRERTPVLWDGGDNALQIVLIYMIFANLGAHFSLDAARRREESPARRQLRAMFHNAAMLAMAVQLCLVYGIAGLYKIQGEMWQSGTALYYVMRVDEFTLPGVSELIYRNVPLVVALTYLTVAFQVAFPFLLFLNRYTRLLVLLGGMTFHLGIAVFMGLVTFAAFFISMELALVTDDEYRAAGSRLRRLRDRLAEWLAVRLGQLRARPALSAWRVQVFYDGWCPFCRRSVALLGRLDTLGLLEPISFREPGVVNTYGLDAERAEARMQARGRRGTTVEGIDAVLLIATRLPLLWPALPLLWTARALGAGQAAYDWIAARRTIIPAGCAQQCELRPARGQETQSQGAFGAEA
ncbi:MAG: hypothetical protein OHK0022_20280 [Roseiflexaceae bacterium]